MMDLKIWIMTFLLIMMAIRFLFYLLDSISVDEPEVNEKEIIFHPSEFKTRESNLVRQTPG